MSPKLQAAAEPSKADVWRPISHTAGYPLNRWRLARLPSTMGGDVSLPTCAAYVQRENAVAQFMASPPQNIADRSTAAGLLVFRRQLESLDPKSDLYASQFADQILLAARELSATDI